MSTWVLTPCKRSRVGELTAMLASINSDPALTVIVTTQPDPIQRGDLEGLADHLLTFGLPGMLFGQWFNLGFDYIASIDPGPHEVLCIGSSLLGDWSTIGWLRDALRSNRLTMVGPDLHKQVRAGQLLTTQHEQRTLWNRVPAQCFMVPGELGLRFDDDFRWWFSDDDLEMQARQLGPVAVVGGMPVIMTHPDGHYMTAEQANHATEDRAKFVTKWNREPW